MTMMRSSVDAAPDTVKVIVSVALAPALVAKIWQRLVAFDVRAGLTATHVLPVGVSVTDVNVFAAIVASMQWQTSRFPAVTANVGDATVVPDAVVNAPVP